MAGSNSQIGGGESSSKAAMLATLSESGRLKLLVKSITEYAIYMLGADGSIASWNPGAEKITGYRSAEAVGQHFSCLFSDEDCDTGVPARLLQEASLDGQPESEIWLLRKDGSRFLANVVLHPMPDASGFPAGFAMVLRDMTAQAAAQEAVLESERRFRLMVEGVVDYAIYMLDPSGLIVNWNAGARARHGLRSPRDRWAAFFAVLYKGGPHGRLALARAWRSPRMKAATSPRAGASRRMAAGSGPRSS